MVDPVETRDRLARLLEVEMEPLLARWRDQVRQLRSAKHLDTPSLNDHIPRVLREIAVALHSGSGDQTIAEALREGSPTAHGLQRVRDAFDIEEVVAEYDILRDCIHDLADQNGLILQGEPFHIVNRVLDGAIGLAVQSFAAYKALEAQEKREEYLAFVAHDLRTPLNAISMAARVLEMTLPRDPSDSGQASRMFNALRRNVQHLEALVAKVLEENTNVETEVGIKLERRDLDLWPLVEALVHDLHPVAGTASTTLVNAIPDDLVAYADAGLLRRVFQNLIANAINYTPRGEVVIEARTLPGGGVECAVRDNGEGMSEERRATVFEKHETDPEKDGIGLGLAIVETFVEAHGGAVSVESKLGVGSTFRFTLPPRQS